MENKNKRHSLFLPILLIAVGVLLFLNTMNVLPGSIWLFLLRLWPLVFIIGGLDGLYKRESYTGSMVSIGLGTVFLLSTLGYLSVNVFQLLLRLWPILLIGWGLDLVLRPRTAATTAIGLILGVLLIAGIIWLSMSSPFGIQKYTEIPINQAIGTAEKGDISVVSTVGRLEIHDGAESNNLIDGSVAVTNLENIETDYTIKDKIGYFLLSSEGVSFSAPFGINSQEATWELALTSKAPLMLSSKLITGQQFVNLSGLTLDEFASETALGSLTITLSDQLGLDGSGKVAIGELLIRVPEGLPIMIEVDTGISAVHFGREFTREDDTIYSQNGKTASHPVNLKVEVPIGSLTIETIP